MKGTPPLEGCPFLYDFKNSGIPLYVLPFWWISGKCIFLTFGVIALPNIFTLQKN